MNIHSTAIVEDGAEIGEGAIVGPYCVVGAQVRLQPGVMLMSHVVVAGATTIGARTIVHPFAVLGGPPQHMQYNGEETRLEVGDDVVIREHVTMNPGTPAGGGVTRVGDRGFFMAAAHVAHDCQIGDDVIFANNATLGGHVQVDDHAFLGGLCAIHQHCRIGAYAFVGGCAAVACDVIPYGSAFGNHARLGGLNVIGMKRRNMPRANIRALREAYRLLFADEAGTFRDRLETVRARFDGSPEVERVVQFIDNGAARSLMTPVR